MKKKVEPKVLKKRKIRYGRIFGFLLFLVSIFFFLVICYQAPIKNIVIEGNEFLKDQEIIDLSGIRDYPSSIQNPSFKIEKKLKENTYIKEVKVTKNWFRMVKITVEENDPLFYYQPNNKTILRSGEEVVSMFEVPFVVNVIPNTKYNSFLEKMSQLPKSILDRISEIKYDPNEVDDGRFLLTMNDGNYVYLTLTRFSVIAKYIEIMSQEEFIGKKGILKLDAGNSFEILEQN